MARVEYHFTEVVDGLRGVQHAVCRCGWIGPARESRRAADDDGAAHESAHNTGSPPRDADADATDGTR